MKDKVYRVYRFIGKDIKDKDEIEYAKTKIDSQRYPCNHHRPVHDVTKPFKVMVKTRKNGIRRTTKHAYNRHESQ